MLRRSAWQALLICTAATAFLDAGNLTENNFFDFVSTIAAEQRFLLLNQTTSDEFLTCFSVCQTSSRGRESFDTSCCDVINVTLYRNGKILKNDAQHTLNCDSQGGSAKGYQGADLDVFTTVCTFGIRGVTQIDEGEYKCAAEMKMPGDSQKIEKDATASVLIAAPPSANITQVSVTGFVTRGKSLVLSCDVGSDVVPLPFLWWEKDGRNLTNSSFIGRSVKYEKEISQLNDNGTYTCWAKNMAGTLQQNAHFVKVVEPEPSVSPGYLIAAGIGGLAVILVIVSQIKSIRHCKTQNEANQQHPPLIRPPSQAGPTPPSPSNSNYGAA
eukprot:m.137027 g.137027  ORF g.137027 m.137027 type:complete len:327 (+) comp38206_c0_seq2:98-1078(+)